MCRELAGQVAPTVDERTANSESVITESHVHDARAALEQSQIEHGMRELIQHDHLAIMAALHLALEGDTPARVREIYPRYRTIADRSEIDPLVHRRMHDHLVDLAMLGIFDRQSRNEGRSGGQCYEYEFSVDLRIVQTVVADLADYRREAPSSPSTAVRVSGHRAQSGGDAPQSGTLLHVPVADPQAHASILITEYSVEE